MTDWSFDEKTGKRSEHCDDRCEWVTVILKNEDESKKYEVEFFFTHNSTKLDSVNLYVKKKKKGYGRGNLTATHKPKKKIEPPPIPEPKQSPSTTKGCITIVCSQNKKP